MVMIKEFSMRKTKIICTMGPAVDDEEKLKELMLNGMDAARFNFSHGTHEEHRTRMERVRKVAGQIGMQIPFILDTKGPEIRVKNFKGGKVVLEKGQLFTLYGGDNDDLGDENGVPVTFPYLTEDVVPGDTVLIDDGLVSMVVEEKKGKDLICRVLNPGKVSDHKSINIPGVDIDQSFISEADRADLLFGIEMGVDFVAASFVRSANDVRRLRKLLNANGGERIRIIAKLENRSGVDHLDEILEIVVGFMVAWGDMGVEIQFRELPSIQKRIIDRCYEKGKLVVTATQMLESMTEHPRPTRAEVSDVANAIYDGTSCIMLSGETAAGKYPVEAVKAMSAIAEYTETQIDYSDRFIARQLKFSNDVVNTIASASVEASFFLDVKAIIVMTATGRTAHVVSFYRPGVPVIACVTDEMAARQLRLDYGVYPVIARYTDDREEMQSQSEELSLSTGIVKPGDLAIFLSGSMAGPNGSDTMRITTL